MRLAESIIFPRVPCSEFHLNRYKRFICNLFNKRPFLTHHKRTKGYERHHIVPKSHPFHGKDDENNLILLKPREHYIAHLLLVKAFPEFKDFTMRCINHFGDRGAINSKLYERFRKGWKQSELTKERISQAKKGITPKITEEQRQNKAIQARINGSKPEAIEKTRLAKRKPEIWDNYEFIKKVWLDNNKCSAYKLHKICGWGKSANSYKTIILDFKKNSDDDMI